MAGIFPDAEWLQGLMDYLNSNETYARVASKWEGDLVFDIRADGPLAENRIVYLDLWHGKCRGAEIIPTLQGLEPAFVLTAPYENFKKVITGKMDAMQALLTRKLKVKGNMGYMMANVPTILEFVRCAQAATDKVLGDEE
jgi:putative sterol carrier protein